jgi:hypothetical protein
MPKATYVALANITLSATDSEIQFASIPNTYRDLVLVAHISLTQTGVFESRVNGSAAGITYVRMMGAVTLGPYSDAGTDPNIGEWYANDEHMPFTLHIMDYASTDKHKTFLSRSNGLSRVMAYAQVWPSTSPITSYSILTNRLFSIGSRFSLYGIEA